MDFHKMLCDDVRQRVADYDQQSKRLQFKWSDAGRAMTERSKFQVNGDCVVAAITIAADLDYMEVWNAITAGNKSARITKRSPKSLHKNADHGVLTTRKWFKDYMKSLGFVWTPTMKIGSGCQVHLRRDEIPMKGRLVVSLSKHYTAVIDGVIHDEYNPDRNGDRCVYGFWTKEE